MTAAKKARVKLKLGQRVKVGPPQAYWPDGVIVRLRTDGRVWVQLDMRPPGLHWDFPANDDRANWKVFDRDQLSEAAR